MIATNPEQASAPNGPTAAAILSAAVGCFTLGIATLAAERSPAIGKFMNFYPPSGALTGETTIAILIWLIVWAILTRLWHSRTCSLKAINLASGVLLLLGLLFTFPPLLAL